MIALAISPEILQQAKADGATRYDPLSEMFFRPRGDATFAEWEHARVWADGLAPWTKDYRTCPPESAVRL